MRGEIIYNVIIITPALDSLYDVLQMFQKIITVHGQAMATLNISICNYQILISITDVIRATYFIHRCLQPYTFSNLYSWCLSCLNYIFRFIYITVFKQRVGILQSFLKVNVVTPYSLKIVCQQNFNIILAQHSSFIFQSVFDWCPRLNHRRALYHR